MGQYGAQGKQTDQEYACAVKCCSRSAGRSEEGEKEKGWGDVR